MLYLERPLGYYLARYLRLNKPLRLNGRVFSTQIQLDQDRIDDKIIRDLKMTETDSLVMTYIPDLNSIVIYCQSMDPRSLVLILDMRNSSNLKSVLVLLQRVGLKLTMLKIFKRAGVKVYIGKLGSKFFRYYQALGDQDE